MASEIFAIIPTFNEEEYLRGTIRSVISQNAPVEILVVNAGRPLSDEISSEVTEIKVSENSYWTHCIAAGIQEARRRNAQYILLLNSDSESVPGSIETLLSVAEHPKTIACSVAYEPDDDHHLRLQYSSQDDWGILRYGKVRRAWNTPEQATTEPYPTDLIGGQGVLIPMAALDEAEVDPTRFPQYAGDHDLWLSLRARGWRLVVHPQAAVINRRKFNSKHKRGLLRTLWWRMWTDQSPESARIMWRLRAKHLPFPVSVASFAGAFLLRWTAGLPKIIERSR